MRMTQNGLIELKAVQIRDALALSGAAVTCPGFLYQS